MRKKTGSIKDYKRKRRHMSLRRRLAGTNERPRVAVFRSSLHIYAQIINDDEGKTIASVSSLKLDANAAKKTAAGSGKEKKAASTLIAQAREVGKLLAEAAREKGVTKIAFDRGGYLYHGRVKALADAARENGLEF